ncbi:MAG: hypothetical protein KC422_26395, partial [Trueperaceae bacterium]|nr:hypothetical protein [Trueperaceae bacterium]
DLYVQTFGTVTAHLPSVGFSKQVAIEDSLFHLRLESQGYYVLFFDLYEHKFSITLDLQDFSPPRLLTETEL